MTRKKIIVKDKAAKARDLDPTQDDFVTSSMSFLDWLVQYRRQVGALIAVALIASLGAIAYHHFRDKKNADMTAKLSGVLDATTALVLPPAPGADIPPPQNDGMLTFDSLEARSTETLSRAAKIQGELDDLYAPILSLLEGAAMADKGDLNAATKLRAFLHERSAPQTWLDPGAQVGLISVLNAAGKSNEAATVAAELKKASSGRLSHWADLELARSDWQSGNNDVARTRLASLMDKLVAEGKPDAQDYLFVEARSMLLSLDPTAQVPDLPVSISPEILQQLLQMRDAGGGVLQ
ncbi:MAG: hypothetical protein M0R76_04190 [Proteobacteria bacterium]|nr:hypothetical protein [Pseudomonadota bacterium]